MSKSGEFVDYGRGHNPDRGIKSYKTDDNHTLKFTNDGKTMSLYDNDPSGSHAGTHITNNGDGTFTVKSHDADHNWDSDWGGRNGNTGHW